MHIARTELVPQNVLEDCVCTVRSMHAFQILQQNHFLKMLRKYLSPRHLSLLIALLNLNQDLAQDPFKYREV